MSEPTGPDPMQQFLARVEELAALQEETRRLIEEDRRRRRRQFRHGIIAFVLAVYTAIALHDQHVEHCMILGEPSTKTEQAICNLTIFFGHRHEIGFDPELIARLRVELGLEGGTP